MAKILVTGSTTGLGFFNAQRLIEADHQVYLHARDTAKANKVFSKLPKAAGVFSAELSDREACKKLAEEVNEVGTFDTIIHNAGVYDAPGPTLFEVNTMAPYLLTSLIKMPKKLIYLSSGLHKSGKPVLEEAQIENTTYADTKLQILILMKAVASRFPKTHSNAVDPGWVPTRMGGKQATGDLEKGFETQLWLTTSDDKEARVSGIYFHHKKKQQPNKEVEDPDLQDKVLKFYQELSGINLE